MCEVKVRQGGGWYVCDGGSSVCKGEIDEK